MRRVDAPGPGAEAAYPLSLRVASRSPYVYAWTGRGDPVGAAKLPDYRQLGHVEPSAGVSPCRSRATDITWVRVATQWPEVHFPHIDLKQAAALVQVE